MRQIIKFNDVTIYDTANSSSTTIHDIVLKRACGMISSLKFTTEPGSPDVPTPYVTTVKVEFYDDAGNGQLVFWGVATGYSTDFNGATEWVCEDMATRLNDMVLHDIKMRKDYQSKGTGIFNVKETVYVLGETLAEQLAFLNTYLNSLGSVNVLITTTNSSKGRVKLDFSNGTAWDLIGQLASATGYNVKVGPAADAQGNMIVSVQLVPNGYSTGHTDTGITYGVNLQDIANDLDYSGMATVIIPYGSTWDDSYYSQYAENPGEDNYRIDLKYAYEDGQHDDIIQIPVDTTSGAKKYIYGIIDDEKASTYGRIIITNVWDECDTSEKLYTTAKAYLNSSLGTATVSVRALALDPDDLTKFSDYAPFATVHVQSEYHDIGGKGHAADFIITESETHIGQPELDTVTLGATASAITSSGKGISQQQLTQIIDFITANINITGGGGDVDAYTKTESDEKFAKRSIYADDKVELGENNINVTSGAVIGNGNNFNSGSPAIVRGNYNKAGVFNFIVGNSNTSLAQSNTIIGNSNNISLENAFVRGDSNSLSAIKGLLSPAGYHTMIGNHLKFTSKQSSLFNGLTGKLILGAYNATDSDDYFLIIGNGYYDNNAKKDVRSDLIKIANDGTVHIADGKDIFYGSGANDKFLKAVALADYYDKEEVNELISTIPKFDKKVVDELPTEDISETTVYLLRNTSGEQGNLYDEYIYVNGAWELLGSQTMDLDGYVQSDSVEYVEYSEDEPEEYKPNSTYLIGTNNTGGLVLHPIATTGKLEDAEQDSLHRTVTDTQIASWNAKANASDIPTELSQLGEDSNHRTVTDVEITAWNGKADFDDIPSKLSDLVDDVVSGNYVPYSAPDTVELSRIEFEASLRLGSDDNGIRISKATDRTVGTLRVYGNYDLGDKDNYFRVGRFHNVEARNDDIGALGRLYPTYLSARADADSEFYNYYFPQMEGTLALNEQFVTLTQAEYDALTEYTPNTTYYVK